MSQIDVLVPELPESITNATIIHWNKKINDLVKRDEILVEIETEKIILEIPSPVDGILTSIIKDEGEIVSNKQIIGCIKKKKNIKLNNDTKNKNNNISTIHNIPQCKEKQFFTHYLSPSIRRNITKNGLQNLEVLKNQSVINKKKDCLNFNINNKTTKLYPRHEKKVLMTPIRQRISERLLYTQNNTAMLTTFNEVNMKSIINIRQTYGKIFQEKHHIKLGFMSFFVKAVVESLKMFKTINARMQQNYIIYYDYFDINIAISTQTGLVTPILKNVNFMSMSKIEKKIQYFTNKSHQGQLTLSDLVGGNFTITNGGVFGSLLSTPIINPPQSAILGIHAIKERPIAINGKIKIAPMMYIALSYDHRLIDGKEAVGFLSMIKNILEDFTRVSLEI
ncbi:dihydrolipoyllysine-residue succinyltransferase [Buchnera aphidicola]|uniref:Dihydrolipoyllysine-residue succinyltransferase n=1 Tax=Buchnera aphidicola (Stegophylla sp.) TaxID=2315800 RepID=A0A4D6YL56_9GAMM|nr:dihydrolipoyllysine-residue succinyltransferase [Buchnera aphidicola (Stegophylla sp.)]QCI26368.1 dihydrolipoyllysine-residue succinyltransferase [Buchnera aphidicola (Stegophylla sp.)]